MTGQKKKFPFKPKILRLELWSVSSKWFLSKWPFLILMKSPFRSKNKTNYKADFSRWRNQSTNVDNASFFIEFHVQGRRRVWKSGVPVLFGEHNLSPHSWDRVNWSAKIWGCHGTPDTPRDDTPDVWKNCEVRKQISWDQTLCTAIHGDIYTAFQWQT